jgi:hypothetical protein
MRLLALLLLMVLSANAEAPKLTVENFHEALTPKGFVLKEDDWHVWCNAPVRDKQGRGISLKC